MAKLWDRQKGESQRAFHAFKTYRDMGPDRSIAKVAQRLGKSKILLERWSVRWNWVMRAEAYDAEMDRRFQMEMEKARKEMAERHAKQAMMFQQKIIERMQKLRPEELSPSDVARWFDIAVKVERLSRGASTEISEVEHSGQVTERHEYDITHRIEQYADEYEQIYEELAKRESAIKGPDEGDDPRE